MPRTPAPQPKRRLGFDIPMEVFRQLNELQHMTSAASFAEVVRRALDVLHFVSSAQRRGKKFFCRSPNGEEKEVFFVL